MVDFLETSSAYNWGDHSTVIFFDQDWSESLSLSA
jgi:hypothetical protein